jgi:hypothetical protein
MALGCSETRMGNARIVEERAVEIAVDRLPDAS